MVLSRFLIEKTKGICGFIGIFGWWPVAFRISSTFIPLREKLHLPRTLIRVSNYAFVILSKVEIIFFTLINTFSMLTG